MAVPRPPRRKSSTQAHSQAQRARILSAARQCFVEHGFHAANMASIAQTAAMSAGLIYRYFPSKNAIILAIIAQQLAQIQVDLAQLQTTPAQVMTRIVERFDQWRNPSAELILTPGLCLEVVALATRDPAVAEALRAADSIIRTELEHWLQRAWGDAGQALTATDVQERAFALQCFMEGLMLRAIKRPDIAPEVLCAGLRPLLAYLLPYPIEDQTKFCQLAGR